MREYGKHEIEIYTKEADKKYVSVVFDSEIDIEVVSLIIETTFTILKERLKEVDVPIVKTAIAPFIAMIGNREIAPYISAIIKEIFKERNNKLTYISSDGRIICNFIYEKD